MNDIWRLGYGYPEFEMTKTGAGADAAWIVSRFGAEVASVAGVSTGGWGYVTWRRMRSRKESRRRAHGKRFVSFQDHIRANPLPGPINRKIGQEP